MDLEKVIRTAVAEAVAEAFNRQNLANKKPPAPPGDPVDDPLLNRVEAARFLNISPITLSIWAHKKRGPEFLRLGTQRAVRYKRSALVAFRDANTGLGQKGRPKNSTVSTSGAQWVKTSGKRTGAKTVVA